MKSYSFLFHEGVHGAGGRGEDIRSEPSLFYKLITSQGNLKGHTGLCSLSNLNHFQFAYILASFSKGKALVGRFANL
jgi:hypothetical protein